MNYRKHILDTIAHQPTPFVPFAPRMDIWYASNKLRGTLPEKYKNATLRDIVDGLGIGYHCIIPDNSLFEDSEDADWDIGLGYYHLKSNPWKIKFNNIKRSADRSVPGVIRTTYETPKGILTCATTFDNRMYESGFNLHVTTEHLIKSQDDFEAAAYIFENMDVEARYEPLKRYQEEYLGDRGVAVAWAGIQACGMHTIVKELMNFEQFVYGLYEEREAFEQLAASIDPFLDKLFDIVAKAPADICAVGGNYDNSITFPDMFQRYILPALQRKSKIAHENGKYLSSHTDGESTGLLDYFVQSGFDIADSVCPAPMTKLTLNDFYTAMKDTTTIWGAVPSISLLDETMTDAEFYKYIDTLFEQIGTGERVIMAIADTTPPAAKFNRIEHIAKVCKEFGPVKF